MKPPTVNEGHVVMGDRARGDIKGMTVPGVVTSLESEANEAYATFDARLRSGLGAYTPAQQLVERALEEICCQMLYWPKYLDIPLSAPYESRSRRGDVTYSMDEKGNPFTILPGELDYDLKAKVVLSPNELIDDSSKITNATNMVQYLGVDKAYALEMAGESDPEKIAIDKAVEILADTEIAGEAMKIQAQKETEAKLIASGVGADLLPILADPQIGPQIVQALTQMAQGIVQQAEQQQAAPAGEVPMSSPDTPQGLMGVEGAGYDASQGGMPAATANPSGNAQANV